MFENETAIDLNRTGTPLLEIVSEPDLYSAKDAATYFRTIQELSQIPKNLTVTYLVEACDVMRTFP